ncbi:MAG: hypothetical protein Q4D79_12800 [Propionibacteriaceae bacterium]|nr:hypothetical protein [Propionibacteriaceae bacterium]
MTGIDAIQAKATDVPGRAIPKGSETTRTRAECAIIGKPVQDAAAKQARGSGAIRAGKHAAAETQTTSRDVEARAITAGVIATPNGTIDALTGTTKGTERTTVAGPRRATLKDRIRIVSRGNVGAATSVVMIVGNRVALTNVGPVRLANRRTEGPAATTEHRGMIRAATTASPIDVGSTTRGPMTDGARGSMAAIPVATPPDARLAMSATPGSATIVAPRLRCGFQSPAPQQLRMSR